MSFENIRPEDIFRQRGNGSCLLLDLRDRAEYAREHIPGAICIPYEELRGNMARLKQWTAQCNRRFGRSALILYCDRGNTSIRAARDLYNWGFNVKNVYGGISAYKGPKVKAGNTGRNLVDGMRKSL
ncbi:MAG: rhodanese-like domain-containing protein [Lachnospiraceae bacterium]|nr:rhodanese-like domain-containing protein [Lachnospiraceae bacterium]